MGNMMKRIYLFMLVLAAALAVRGDVAVQSMSLQPTDLTAVQMGRTDLTGAPCAVVRVVLPRDGVTFEGNVIGAPVFTGSEWHVALTEGTKQMKISVPGSAPVMVTFADYGIPPLQGKATYQLVLSDVSGTYTGTIYFSPATAAVVVDNQTIPTSDGVATVNLPAGNYPYSVSAPGYQSKMGILTITSSGRNEDDIVLRRDPNASQATVAQTTPAQQARPTAPAQPSRSTSPSLASTQSQQPTTLAPASTQQTQATVSGIYDGHEYVDLGLPSGLKWATCNIGAYKPTDYGEYFAWGETVPKGNYVDSNSKTYFKSVLEFDGVAEYDAARTNWVGRWRMPTEKEFEELRKNCHFKWIEINGVNCGVFISKNNSACLILPAAGYKYETNTLYEDARGLYWSASPYWEGYQTAWFLSFTEIGSSVKNYKRSGGHSIRPVAN